MSAEWRVHVRTEGEAGFSIDGGVCDAPIAADFGHIDGANAGKERRGIAAGVCLAGRNQDKPIQSVSWCLPSIWVGGRGRRIPGEHATHRRDYRTIAAGPRVISQIDRQEDVVVQAAGGNGTEVVHIHRSGSGVLEAREPQFAQNAT